jgi:hypothetical protein
MDILTILLALLSLAAGIVLKLIASEFQDWIPTLARRLVDHAVVKLSETDRERYREEW